MSNILDMECMPDPLQSHEIKDEIPKKLMAIPNQERVSDAVSSWINHFSGYPSILYHPNASRAFVGWCQTLYQKYGESVLGRLLLSDYMLNTEFVKCLPRDLVWDIIPAGVTYGEKYLLWDTPWDISVYEYLIKHYGEGTEYVHHLDTRVCERFMRDYPDEWGHQHLHEITMLLMNQNWRDFSKFTPALQDSIRQSKHIAGIAFVLYPFGIPRWDPPSSSGGSIKSPQNDRAFFDEFYPRLNDPERSRAYLERIVRWWSLHMYEREDSSNRFVEIEGSLRDLQSYEASQGLTAPSIFTEVWANNLARFRAIVELDLDPFTIDWTVAVDALDVSIDVPDLG